MCAKNLSNEESLSKIINDVIFFSWTMPCFRDLSWYWYLILIFYLSLNFILVFNLLNILSPKLVLWRSGYRNRHNFIQMNVNQFKHSGEIGFAKRLDQWKNLLHLKVIRVSKQLTLGLEALKASPAPRGRTV